MTMLFCQVEELQEREVIREVAETRKLPQVKALYPFKGNGIETKKGEVSQGDSN